MVIKKRRVLTVIGMMSGTSFDGIDAALIRTDGLKISSFGDTYMSSYSDGLRKKIRLLMNKKYSIRMMMDVEDEIAIEHSRVVHHLLKKANLTIADIDLIGFHGQTIYHNPVKRKTLQIGNAALLAELTGINVISDFRSHDVAAGGEGAPLVPFYHQAICKSLKKPVAVVNIGGVANVSYIDNDHLIAFDTGPGGALLDDWVYDRTRRNYDDDGKIARKGIPHEAILESFMRKKFFNEKPPKSLDRNKFKAMLKTLDHLTTEDGAATLTYLTARSVYEARKFFPKKPLKWILCGGGSHNSLLVDILSKQYGLEVVKIDEIKIGGKTILAGFVEAQAFGFLAARSFYNLPLTTPTTTGVKREVSGGALYKF
jgi:anhydro-N-acetylmuramic acid kinase